MQFVVGSGTVGASREPTRSAKGRKTDEMSGCSVEALDGIGSKLR
jgi:hypothetical protein